MKIAVIKTGGKQYKVTSGDVLEVEKIDGKKESKIIFDQVLLISDDKQLMVGNPTVKDAKVEGKIIVATPIEISTKIVK